MNEKPILFSGSMVRAILEGRKTQTRRIIKGAPTSKEAYLLGLHEPSGTWAIHDDVENDRGVFRFKSLYGKPGDRLWVRENFTVKNWSDYECQMAGCPDAAIHPTEEMFGEKTRAIYQASYRSHIGNPGKWRPSIHMPRWASRITLEITGVRVERLNAISEQEAISEGVTLGENRSHSFAEHHLQYQPAKTAFIDLWASINGVDSWNANPWVWVVKFKRVEET